jgi:hypothetical protein
MGNNARFDQPGVMAQNASLLVLTQQERILAARIRFMMQTTEECEVYMPAEYAAVWAKMKNGAV